MSKQRERLRIALGAAIVLSILNPLAAPFTLTLVAVLWLLQWKAPLALSGAASAPTPVKWYATRMWQFIQKNLDNSNACKKVEQADSDQDAGDLLWHFSFGANMNPEVLGGRRKVIPKQSLPCVVEGFSLLFSHRGLPYWEPSFATISASSEALQAATSEANAAAAECASPAAGSPATNGRVTRSATRAAAGTANGDASSNGHAGSGKTNGNSAANGLTNGKATGKQHAGGSAADRRGWSVAQSSCSQACSMLRAPLRLLSALGRLILGDCPPSVAPRQYKAASGQPAVHGVVHQITAADMRQIRITEGGGGHDKLGYNLEEVTCTLYDGSSVKAVAFTTFASAQTCKSLVFAHPSERYLKVCQKGAQGSGIQQDYLAWMQELKPYRRETLGQFLGAYLMIAFMTLVGLWFAAFLAAYRLVMRRKLDSYYHQVFMHHVMGGVWWVHNTVLAHTLGRGC